MCSTRVNFFCKTFFKGGQTNTIKLQHKGFRIANQIGSATLEQEYRNLTKSTTDGNVHPEQSENGKRPEMGQKRVASGSIKINPANGTSDGNVNSGQSINNPKFPHKRRKRATRRQLPNGTSDSNVNPGQSTDGRKPPQEKQTRAAACSIQSGPSPDRIENQVSDSRMRLNRVMDSAVNLEN